MRGFQVILLPRVRPRYFTCVPMGFECCSLKFKDMFFLFKVNVMKEDERGLGFVDFNFPPLCPEVYNIEVSLYHI